MAVLNQKSEHYSYDLSKNCLSVGEVFDQESILQSIELILTTFFGERFMNPSYGSSIPMSIHEIMNNAKGEKLIEDALSSLAIHEDRIVVDQQNVKFIFFCSFSSF